MKQTTLTLKPKPTPTDLDRVLRDQAVALYNKTGEGFVMHMNDGSTLCRNCVSRESPAIFNTLLNWSKEDKGAATFADLYSREMAGKNRCSRCGNPFTAHRMPPPLSLSVSRMGRGGKSYSYALFNQTLILSTLPTK